MKPRFHKLLALILFATGAATFLRWVPDDAYISFRYARNFAEGYGLVFNPGERVEGYSNFLWTLILGLGQKAGIDIVKAAVTLSAVFALGTIALAMRLFDGIASDVAGPSTYRSHLYAMSIMLVASLPMMYWATSGLETYAAAFFLLVGVILHLEAEREDRPRRHAGSVVAFLLVAVLRPEGIAYFAINAVVVMARRRHRLPRTVLMAIGASTVVFAAFLTTRTLYYHSLVPNTYWAKPSTTIGYWAPLSNGVRYILRYLIVSGLILMLPIGALAYFRARNVRYTVRYLTGVLAVQFAFIIWVGGDVLRFDRFTVAFHPFLAALILVGAVSWEARHGKHRLLRIAVWGCLAATVLLNGARVYRAHSKYCVHDWMHARFHARLGRALGEMLPPDATLVINEIGAVPYYSHLVTYDMIGLTDKTVASIIYESYHEYGTAQTDLVRTAISDYLMSRNPTCVVLPSYGPIDLTGFTSPPEKFHAVWEGIYRNRRFEAEYRPVFSVSHFPGKFLNVYLRRGVSIDLAPLKEVSEPDCVTVTVVP